MYRFIGVRILPGLTLARESAVRGLMRNSTAQISRNVGGKVPVRNSIFKRFQSTIKSSTPNAKTPDPLAKRATGIKALMKEYGYSALGVYLGLSAIDLPLFYLLVHSMGKEEIEYYENKVKQTFGFGMTDEELKKKHEIDQIHAEHERNEQAHDHEASASESQSTLLYVLSQFSWAEFAIAYTLHKSFIFLRVPLTAAVTPPVVKVLRGWGFRLGTDKLATSANLAKNNIKDFTASNTKFGTRPNRKKKWFDFFF